MTIKATLREATKSLQTTSDSSALDAEVLLCYVLEVTKEKLYGQLEQDLTADQLEKYKRLVARRQKHEPVAYIVRHKEFYGLDFYVDERVLIPRPDTEVLVAKVIDKYGVKNERKIIADVGTGSGCIAVALARNLSRAKIYAVDVSEEALAVAKINIEKHKAQKQIKLLAGDLLEPLPEKVDIIVSNPPYIARGEIGNLKPTVVDHEPRQALLAGSEGLQFYQKILGQACDYLRPKGFIALEIDPLVAKQVFQLAQKYFPHSTPQIKKDLAGRERVLVVETD